MIILASFSIVWLIASLLYWMKYSSWIGNNIVVKIILLLYIIWTVSFFIFVLVIEFSDLVHFTKYRSAKNSKIQKWFRIIFFFIPVLHWMCIVAFWYYRRSVENDDTIHFQGKYGTKGRISLSYKPQTNETTNIPSNIKHQIQI